MSERNVVPCNGCQACCKNERIILSAEHGDDPMLYACIPTRKGNDGGVETMLRHKPNGECIYLTGCGIHERAPWACRMFDCRRWYLGFPEAIQPLLEADDLAGKVVEAARAGL